MSDCAKMQLFLVTGNGNPHTMRYYLLVVEKKTSMVVFQYLRREMENEVPCPNCVVFVVLFGHLILSQWY